MQKMAEAFNTSLPLLENEVMTLILDSQINARIDSHNKVSLRHVFSNAATVAFSRLKSD